MKKKQISFDKKLTLDKETVATLNDEQSSAVEGGNIFTITCNGGDAAAVEVDKDDVEASCLACSCNK